jgi:hypothetical protein
VRVAVWLAAVSGLVLVIAAANVALLLLARGLAREGEAALRAALGATRGRLARRWLAEGVLLGAGAGGAALLVAGGVGLALARLGVPGASPAAGAGVADGTSGAGALAAGGLGGALGAAADGRVVAVVAALAALAGLACGAVPALAAGRHDLAAVLAGLAGGRAGRPRAARLRAALLATQVALTATLLVGAGLFARSLARVDGLALGVDVDRLLVVRVNGQDAGLSEAAVDTLLGRLADRARGVPGVAAVSRAHTVPFVSAWRTRFYVSGRDPERWGNEGGGRYNLLEHVRRARVPRGGGPHAARRAAGSARPIAPAPSPWPWSTTPSCARCGRARGRTRRSGSASV